MASNLRQLVRRRWLVSSALAGVVALAGATSAAAAGLQTATGAGACAGDVQSGATYSTSSLCAVTTTTTLSPLPGGASAGEATITAVTTIAASCGTTATDTAYITLDYTDALGGFLATGYIPYSSSDGKTCTTNYAGMAAPLTLSGQSGSYMAMTELCAFSDSGPYEAGTATSLTAFWNTKALSFTVDNGANGTCTPSN